MPSKGPAKSSVAAAESTVAALRNCFDGAVLVADRAGRIVVCSPAAESALRLKPGKTVLPAALRKLVRDCLATGEPVLTKTISPSSKNSKAALSVSAVPLRRGRVTEVVVVLHDFTPLQQIESNLRHLDRLASIGTLAAGTGHEIKNALVAVKTFVDLLLEKNRDAELSDVVQREMQRIATLVSQMLKFAGPARPAFSPVRLHDVLDHSLRMVQHQMEGKLISLNRSFAAAPDSVQGDDYQLEQAFVNLLLNAVEAMGPNGSLKVTTESVPAPASDKLTPDRKPLPCVRVTISDTGVGVAPENMGHLFEPFFTTKHNGTGLGLPITRRIVQEHHGDISVQSEVNKGTTFNILLPANAKPR